MASNGTNRDLKDDTIVVSVHEIDETTPLLASPADHPAYLTSVKPADEEKWQPSPGFWWIETGSWNNDTT
jgi:hypothetical protein